MSFLSVPPPELAIKKIERKGWRIKRAKAPLCPKHTGLMRAPAPTKEEAPAAVAGMLDEIQKDIPMKDQAAYITLDLATLDAACRPGARPSADVVIITPEFASHILTFRHRTNRNIRPMKLAQLVSDIKGGNFKLNGETIIFDDEGVLMDGQHRLRACMDTGVSIIVLTAFAFPKGAMGTVDQGASRKASDVLAIDGEVSASTLAAVARMVVAYEANEGKSFANSSAISRGSVIDAVAIYPDIADSVKWQSHHQRLFSGIATGSVFAFCHFILAQRYSREAVEYYLERVIVGDELRVGQPAFSARRRLMASGKKTAAFSVEVILRAWLSHLRGKDISIVPTTGEFPHLISERHRNGSMKAVAKKGG